MNVVDILISIVVVTILVTIILAIVTYVAYKLRLAREPAQVEGDPTALRYFVRYDPPGAEPRTGTEPDVGAGDRAAGTVGEREDISAPAELERDVADVEGHATPT